MKELTEASESGDSTPFSNIYMVYSLASSL